MIKLADYPQLRMLAWSRPAHACLAEDEAFCLYESNWRFLVQGSMQPAEAALLQRPSPCLPEEDGHGCRLDANDSDGAEQSVQSVKQWHVTVFELL